MATNTAGSKGQDYYENMVHYLAKTVTYGDDDVAVELGIMPPGAVVIEVGVVVTTAFVGGTPVLQIGTSDDPNAFGTDLALGTAGRIIDTAINANDDYSASADVTVTATVSSGSTITAGSGVAYALYILADR